MGDLLFLAHRIPYPPTKGDKIRSWNILKYVAERAPVHLGAFVDDPEDMKHAEFLASVCKSVKLIPMEPRDRLKRAWTGWRKGEALSIALFDDRAMKRWVWDRVKHDDIDRVFVFSSQMAPYALGHTSQERRVVMDFVDIDSDKFAQYAKESRWPKSRLYAREAKLLQAFEKQVARHVDVSLFVSDAETAMFRRLAGSYAHTVDTLHNGVDLAYFFPGADFAPLGDEAGPKLVFTGAMDYRPNVDAVCWFADAILPLVRKRYPAARFFVVGGKPSPEVQALASREGIVVTGRVPDVRPYVAAADVAVAPVRIARGVQNKVLEAMALARPVVATEAAWSGIDAEPERDLLVRSDAESFAAAVCAVLDDPALGARLAGNARQQVESRYAWPAQLAKLDAWLGLGAADSKVEAA